MKATEVTDLIANSPMSLEDKLSWHFTSFERKIPESMIPVCKAVIQIANTNGDLTQVFELPDGATFDGGNTAVAQDILDTLFLSAFVTEQVSHE
jgi:hypothetical protein